MPSLPKNPFFLALYVLILFEIVLVLVYLFGDSALEEFLPNFISEIAGIILTVGLVQVILEYEKHKQDEILRRIAYAKIDQIVFPTAMVFVALIRSSLDTHKRYPKLRKRLKTLFSSYLVDELAHLNPQDPQTRQLLQTLESKEHLDLVHNYLPHLSAQDVRRFDEFMEQRKLVSTLLLCGDKTSLDKPTLKHIRKLLKQASKLVLTCEERGGDCITRTTPPQREWTGYWNLQEN